MNINHTKEQLDDFAEEKFTRFIEDEALDEFTSDEVTILFAIFAKKSGEYAADAIDW